MLFCKQCQEALYTFEQALKQIIFPFISDGQEKGLLTISGTVGDSGLGLGSLGSTVGISHIGILLRAPRPMLFSQARSAIVGHGSAFSWSFPKPVHNEVSIDIVSQHLETFIIIYRGILCLCAC